jgi:hypothetical protein
MENRWKTGPGDANVQIPGIIRLPRFLRFLAEDEDTNIEEWKKKVENVSQSYYNIQKGERMQQLTVRQQIDKELEVLPVDLQRKVLDYISHLSGPGIPPGVPGSELIKFAGTLSDEDAEELIQIIEEGCERIDYNEW